MKNILFFLFSFLLLAPACTPKIVKKEPSLLTEKQPKKLLEVSPETILWSANWSADGKYIAVGGDDKILRFYDGKTFKILRRDTLVGNIMRLRWHPSEPILAVAAGGDASQIIHFEKKKSVFFKGAPELGGRAIEWSFDGKYIAIADYSKKISIWTKDAKLIRTIENKTTKSYVGIDWHPSKYEFITLSDSVRVFNLEGDLKYEFRHRREEVLMLCVEWHPSGSFFIIGDYGDYDYKYSPLLQFWKPDKKFLKASPVSTAEYRNISWNSSGLRLATASECLRVWDKNGTIFYQSLPSEDLLWGVDWSPDGTKIVTSSTKGVVSIWSNKAKLLEVLPL